jgi:lipoyl(octanoyl) transferase
MTVQLPPMSIVRLDLGRRHVPYAEAWDRQRAVHADVVAGRRPATLLLLEHESVFTAGSRTRLEDRPVDGSPVIDVDRGGRITWHGPGQLVGYPILRLPHPFDVVAYVRALEDLLLRTCRRFGVTGERVDGRSGVWVHGGRDKVAAIGVRVAQGVTMHGFALNCDCRLDWADAIVPCGIPDAGVTSLSTVTGATVTVSEAADVLESLLPAAVPA